MLSKWLQSGFGQVLAPDPNAPAGDDGSGDGIWTIIAPDPNFDRPGGKSGSADGAMAEAEADAATATAVVVHQLRLARQAARHAVVAVDPAGRPCDGQI